MRIITLTEEEFDNFSNKHKYNTYYQMFAPYFNVYQQMDKAE